jgi:hypothetical protein
MFVVSGGAGLMRGNRGGRTVMSHAAKADELLIKPAAGARPAPPHTRRQIIPKARTQQPDNQPGDGPRQTDPPILTDP